MSPYAFFIMFPREIPYYKHIIYCFAASEVDIFIGWDISNSLNSFANEYKDEIEEIKLKGYNISSSTDSPWRYKYIICSHQYFSHKQNVFDWKDKRYWEEKGSRIALLIHSTDSFRSCRGTPINWCIYAFQRYSQVKGPNRLLPHDDSDRFSRAIDLPIHMKCKFGFSGPYHIGDWATKRYSSSENLKIELETTLGIDLPKDKPNIIICNRFD